MARESAAERAGWESLAQFRKYRTAFNATFSEQIGPRQYERGREYYTRSNVLEINAQRGGWNSYAEYRNFRRFWNKARPNAQIRGGDYKGALKQYNQQSYAQTNRFESEWESDKQYRAYQAYETRWEAKESISGRMSVQHLLQRGIDPALVYWQHSQVFNIMAGASNIVDKIDHETAMIWQRYWYVDVLEEFGADEWDLKY
jgi:hypothetical protein